MNQVPDSYGDDPTRGGMRQLGVYRLDEPLGRGGMGMVWKAWDTAGQRVVAVKLLPPEFKGNPEAVAQVREAFGVVHALTHQHIGKTIGLFEDPQHGPYIVLEFLPGVPLTQFVKKYCQPDGTVPLGTVVRLLRPVALALDYGHAEGVLHRDVKPDNILVEDRDGQPGKIWLIDYGLAAEIRATSVTHTNATVDTRGTRPYMAPEQLKGKRKLWDARTDQYALGVVAYELLAGERPFDADDEMTLMFAIMQETIEPIAGLADTINAALLTALAKTNEGRHVNCVAFLDALAQGSTSAVGWVESARPNSPVTDPIQEGGPHRASTHPTKAAPPLMKAPFDTAAAKAGQAAWAEYLGVPVIEKNAAGIELALIPPGEFLMGSSDADVAAALAADPTKAMKAEYLDDERPQHVVRITRPFQLGIYPVTQQQFKQLMGHNPSAFSLQGDKKEQVERIDDLWLPVENVTWFDAVVFCNKLSERCGLPPYYDIGTHMQMDGKSIQNAMVEIIGGKGYRLPTEAEWEYACRAGTTTAFWFGNKLNGEDANVYGGYPYGTTKRGPALHRPSTTGDYPANPYGCNDLHGNVWEWCEDYYDPEFYEYINIKTDDPRPVSPSYSRVLRGGSYRDPAWCARVTRRHSGWPADRNDAVGFRLARTE